MLAVMGALDEEVGHLRADMTISDETRHAGIQVTHGSFKNVDIALAKCGIGKVNATICTQMLIDLYKPDAMFPDPGVGPNLMLGTIASGDRFIQDQKTLRWLQREFAALATEMEGAAFGYTCHLNGVPFVVVRGLSDTADHNASDDFSSNLHIVSRNMYPYLERLIPVLAR